MYISGVVVVGGTLGILCPVFVSYLKKDRVEREKVQKRAITRMRKG